MIPFDRPMQSGDFLELLMQESYLQLRTQYLRTLGHMRHVPARFDDPRPANAKITEIVLHDTDSRRPFGLALQYLANATDRHVSIHYLVGQELGQLYGMVPEHRRAHHVDTVARSSRSIGIEMYKLHSDRGDFSQWQYTAVSELVFDLRLRYGIPRDKVIAHASFDPHRGDPRNFDWARLNYLVDAIAVRARAITPEFGI